MTFRPRIMDLIDFSVESEDPGSFQGTVRENFRRIRDWFAPYGGRQPDFDLLAWLLGGEVLTGEVTQISSGDPADDTVFPHGLERVPTMVLLAVDRDGLGGQIHGAPEGGNGSSGGNEAAWTRTQVAVRASRTGNYSFMIL